LQRVLPLRRISGRFGPWWCHFPPEATDIVGSYRRAKLTEAWGHQVIVDNRGGARRRLGSDVAAKSPADLLHHSRRHQQHACHRAQPVRKLGYDPVRDFAPVARSPTRQYCWRSISVPAKNVRELIALAKRQPNALSFASSGNGGISHLIGEQFKVLGGIRCCIPQRRHVGRLPIWSGG
jgi:tripartite-type tricarboxylate transporter receptor subunit TctC